MSEQISKQKQKSDDIFVINSEGLDLEELEVKSGERKDYLKTTITTDEKDLVNDVVTQKCMDSMVEQLKERTVKLDFEHEAFRGETKKEQEINKTREPLGKRVGWERKADHIDVTWELNKNWKKFDEKGNITKDFKEIKESIKDKYYDGTSIAYIATDVKKEEKKGESVRLLNDLRLLNVALTGNPVNTGAKVKEVFRKSIGNEEEKSIKEELRELKEKVDKLESNSQSNKKLKKEEKMTEEEQDEEEQQDEKAEDEDEEEEKSEDNEDSNEEQEDKAFEELKSKVDKLAEDKSEQEKEIKALKEKVEEQEKALSKPQHKGKSEQREAETEGKSSQKVNPLNAI